MRCTRRSGPAAIRWCCTTTTPANSPTASGGWPPPAPAASAQAELPPVDTGGAERGQLLGNVPERPRRLAVGIDGGDRTALVAALAHGVHKRDLPEQGDPEVCGKGRTAACAEELVALPVVAGEPAHVLDDAAHGELEPPGGERRALRHPLCSGLRRRHDDDLRPRHHLGQGERDVA